MHIHAVLAGDGGVLGGGDALQDQRNRVRVLEVLHVVPVERRLELNARSRRRATA